MHEQALFGILAISFIMGSLHALDADHVLAVSSLASRKRGGSSCLFYALQWALGHGGILLLIAITALYFGMQLPAYILHSAEKVVGLILIFSGLSIIWSLYRQKVRIRMHRHGDMVHAHLATADEASNHDHAPVLVGIVHGLAGSAPALALIPATLYHPALGLGYIAIFSIGVLTGMVAFGALLGRGQRLLFRHSPHLLDIVRGLFGVGATAFGVIWLSAA